MSDVMIINDTFRYRLSEMPKKIQCNGCGKEYLKEEMKFYVEVLRIYCKKCNKIFLSGKWDHIIEGDA